MKKRYSILFILFYISPNFAQNPEIKNDLPTVITPSPTVAALMKFEEVPVSNYTGVPDISIPLFNVPTHSKDVNLNISLKYHSGVSANDIASDVGLGWSLFAGGTISRTVRGLPDEQLILDGNHGGGKVGIYQTSYSNHINNYYNFQDNYFNDDEYSIYDNTSLSSTEKYMINEFVWSAAELGRYDTEHDLWQFNFMGHSGRFYIKKNMTTNQLEVVPLDDYRLKILYTHTSQSVYDFIPSQFTIFDEKGYKYVFNITEKTKNFSAVENFLYGSTSVQYTTTEKEHISAIHLSQVFDTNGNVIVNFLYTNNNDLKECTNDRIDNYLTPIGLVDYQYYAINYPCMGEFKPLRAQINNFTLTTVRKLTGIEIIDSANVEFNYQSGRLDSNIGLQGTAPFLESVTLKDLNNNPIKSYHLEHDYSAVLTNRMILEKVIEKSNNTQNQVYEFFYEQNETTGGTVGKDYWGFLNFISSCGSDPREAVPTFSTTDLLQKIKYPSGGCAIFDFEANQYSYRGSEALSNFDENPYNFTLSATTAYSFFNSTNNNNTVVVNNQQPGIQLLNVPYSGNIKAKFVTSLAYPQDHTATERRFILMKSNGADWTYVADLTCQYNESTGSCCYNYVLEAGYQYAIKREILVHPFSGPSDEIAVQYYIKNAIQKQYLYGGGNRIKQIGYFDVDVEKEYLRNNQTNIPYSKLKKYNYNFFDDVNKSSGSLVYKKPTFNYFDSFMIQTACNLFQPNTFAEFNYMAGSNKNYLVPVKTQGSDVGYKNVTVFETNNGNIQFTYSSPIDNPEVISSHINHHIPSKNIDYKRGLLMKEVVFDQTKALSESLYEYVFSEYTEETGVKIFRLVDDIYFQGSYFTNFASLHYDYSNNIDIMGSAGPLGMPGFYLKSPIDFHSGSLFTQRNFHILPVKEAYGWAKLDTKTTKNYFYPNNSTTPNIFQTTETYDYNPINKKISESTVTNSQGEVLKTNYFYHTGNSTYSQNRISEIDKIETYRGANLLSTSKINYANTFAGNTCYLPVTIATAKAAQTLENRVRYLKYDEFSNPLEVEQEGGTKLCYIWGYDKTQPVAKIENIDYASIPSTVITAIQNASNVVNNDSTPTTLAANLQALQDELEALRDHTALASAIVTTYTYIPVVGVKTITDPKGDKTTYEYDIFNRVKEVRDNDNNILSENQYHYKN